LAARRENYQRTGLRRADLADDPVTQFEQWFDTWLSTEPYDGNAVVLATADPAGRPSARYVLLKGVSSDGFVFYTDRLSRKGEELTANAVAALCFGWLDLNRQVRVEGPVAEVSAEESDAYFASRPRGSQLGAWASEQSRVLADRQELEDRLAEVTRRFGDGDVPRPPNWGGYRLRPDAVEFWQGRTDRLHDRFRYCRDEAAGWRIERLSP
jgi:pyridoxamine 5'-phosphate oxidase